MYEDVPISNMPNKVRVIELVNANVIPRFLNKTLKGQFLLPFFLSEIKFPIFLLLKEEY